MGKNRILILIVSLCSISVLVGIFQLSTMSRQPQPARQARVASKQLLVVTIEGVIKSNLGRDSLGFIDNETQRALRQLNQAYFNPDIKGILLRINSPGGTVGASQELYKAVGRLRSQKKYVVVSVADICTSGAYYVASAADQIFCNGGSIIGSVGVILDGTNLQRLFDKLGIEKNVITSGEYKDILAYWKAPTEAERNLLQSLVDTTHEQFIQDILAYRKDRITDISAIRESQIYTGLQALEIGMVDVIGDKIEAMQYLAKQVNIPLTSAVVYEREGLFDRFFSEFKLESLAPRLIDSLRLQPVMPLCSTGETDE